MITIQSCFALYIGKWENTSNSFFGDTFSSSSKRNIILMLYFTGFGAFQGHTLAKVTKSLPDLLPVDQKHL